jgi:hypothetical protein
VGGLALWLDASQESYANGASAPIWHDSSGNGNDVSGGGSGTNAPTFAKTGINGQPAFNLGPNTVLTRDSSTLPIGNPSFDVFLVFNKATAGDSELFSWGQSVPFGRIGFYFAPTYGSGGTYTEIAHTNSASPVLASSTPYVFESCYNGTDISTVQHYVNGTAVTMLPQSGTPALTSSAITIGQFGGYAGQGLFSGLAAEVIVYNHLLADTDRAAIDTYLGIKYSITLNATVNVTWDSSPDPSVVGYTVQYGTTEGTYPFSRQTESNSATITGLGTGTYYFVVSAINKFGLASPPSNSISLTLGGPRPPSPTGLRIISK